MAFFRRIDEEYETRLRPPDGGPSASASGKTERKKYGDGEERLKVKARDVDLDDGTVVRIVIRDEVVAEVVVEKGRIKFDETSADRRIPRVQTGDRIELVADGVVHLVGDYEPD